MVSDLNTKMTDLRLREKSHGEKHHPIFFYGDFRGIDLGVAVIPLWDV